MRTGRTDQAAAHVAAAQDTGLPAISSRLAMITCGATALAATSDDDACALFDLALGVAAPEQWPFDLARIQLGYGETTPPGASNNSRPSAPHRRTRHLSGARRQTMDATSRQRAGCHRCADQLHAPLRLTGNSPASNDSSTPSTPGPAATTGQSTTTEQLHDTVVTLTVQARHAPPFALNDDEITGGQLYELTNSLSHWLTDHGIQRPQCPLEHQLDRRSDVGIDL